MGNQGKNKEEEASSNKKPSMTMELSELLDLVPEFRTKFPEKTGARAMLNLLQNYLKTQKSTFILENAGYRDAEGAEVVVVRMVFPSEESDTVNG